METNIETQKTHKKVGRKRLDEKDRTKIISLRLSERQLCLSTGNAMFMGYSDVSTYIRDLLNHANKDQFTPMRIEPYWLNIRRYQAIIQKVCDWDMDKEINEAVMLEERFFGLPDEEKKQRMAISAKRELKYYVEEIELFEELYGTGYR